jgi:hypothetical protein
MHIRFKGVIADLFTVILFFCGICSACASKSATTNWANGYTDKTAAFERIALFVDLAVVRSDASGKIYISLNESLNDAEELDDLWKTLIEEKGYEVGTHGHYFVGSYASDGMNVSLERGKAGLYKEPPYHVDPEVMRVEQLQKDVQTAIKMFSEILAEGRDSSNAAIPQDIAQRLGGNYRSSGFALAVGQVRNAENLPTKAVLTPERISKLRTSFLAIGYFEAMTGRMVYCHKELLGGEPEIGALKRIFKTAQAPFPPARQGAARFEVPPIPKYEGIKSDQGIPMGIPAGEILPGTDLINVIAIVKGKGGVPFTKNPLPSRLDTRLIPSGSEVRILGYQGVYTKVILQDGSIGYVPSAAVWIKK